MNGIEVVSGVFYAPQHAELLPAGLLRVPVVERLSDGTEVVGHRDIGPDFPTYSLWRRLMDEKCEDIDLFDGFGNGSLHFTVGLSRYLELDFHPADWEALFLETLGCPPYDPCRPEEDANQCRDRNRRLFRAAILGYPLLGRIYDLYEDALFSSEEVPLLREECERAKNQANHPGGIRALRKLIFAANEAIEAK
ncbi:MAG: hypothetical protein V4671_19650, partial [Armatimonadota bacterium]